MTAWLLLGGTVIGAVFLGYQMVVSHTEKIMSLTSRLLAADSRVGRLEELLVKKNDYIKRLEITAIELASPEDVGDMLTDFFVHKDTDSGDN